MNALSILSPRPSLSSAPRTPRTRSLTASPPAVNRLSTDSWNSSNGEFEDLSVPWSPDHLRLLARTLDALPSHLTTPFNGPVPPSNLLHKIATGIAQAKGPNDWPHSVRATRIKLLHIARDNASDHDNARGGLRADVLQQTTNTASPRRARPLYRQSSMDFMLNAKLDRDLDHNDTIARLSHRLQKHERTLTSSYHPYLRPAKHHSLAPSTPSSSTLNSSTPAPRPPKSYPYSRLSASSTSSFGSPVHLRPSSLRRASTLTLNSTSEMDVDLGVENRRSAEYDTTLKGRALKRAPSFGTPSKPPVKAAPKTSPPTSKIPVTPPTSRIPRHTSTTKLPRPPATPSTRPKTTPKPNARKTSSSPTPSDEEERVLTRHAKKVRTREPSWSMQPGQTPGQVPQVQSPKKPKTRASISISKPASTDNDLSTSSSSMATDSSSGASMATASSATSVSSGSPSVSSRPRPSATGENGKRDPAKKHTPAKETRRPIPLSRTTPLFGPELPCPQPTPAFPSKIPVSASAPLPPASPGMMLDTRPSALVLDTRPSALSRHVPSPMVTSTPPPQTPPTRPRTLRRAARRISFGSLGSGQMSPVGGGDGGGLGLGSAFQLA